MDDYEIRVRGHLAPRWAERFEGMTFTRHDDGTTVITGPVADQAALHGLLRTVGDIGVPLVRVARVVDHTPATDQHGRTP